MAKQREVSIILTVREEISKIFPKIGRAIDAVKRDLKELKTPAGAVRVAFRNMRRAGRVVIATFRRIGQAAGRLRRALLGIRSLVGALFAAFVVGRGIGALFETVEQLDRLAKTADKLGILPERLVELRFAAEQSGVAVNTFDLGLQRMIRRVAEAAAGTGEAQGALKELGLDAQALAEQRPDEIFLAIAEAMQEVEGEGKRVALTFKLFDSEGVALKNTLALGADELARLARQARILGLVLDRDQLQVITGLSDAVNRMRRAWQGLKQALAVSVAPVLSSLIDDLTVLVVVLPKLIDNLARQLRVSFSEGAEGREARGQVAQAITSLFAFITDLVVESVRILVFAFVQALIVAFKAFAPQLQALGRDLLFRISEGSLGQAFVYTEERRRQLKTELATLQADLESETEALGVLKRGGGGILDLIFGAESIRRLQDAIKLIEQELGSFGDVTAAADKSRREFEGELALTAEVMSQAFESAGEEIKKSGAGLLDAFKALVSFDIAADPQLIEDLKTQIAAVRGELGQLEDFDAGQAESAAGALIALEKLIDLREAQAAGDDRRTAVLQLEIRHTAELTQLRANLIKSGEAQGQQTQVLLGRLTALQATERRALTIRQEAQEQLDRVLEAEEALRDAVEDRTRAVELGLSTQQAATAATQEQAAALLNLAAETRNTIAALGGGPELIEFVEQIDRVVAGLTDIAGRTGGIFAGIRAGINDFITEAANGLQQFQQLTTDLLGTIRSGFAGIFSGVIRGTQDVGQAFEDMLFRMLDRVLVFLTDQVILQFLQLFTAEGVLGAAFQQFTASIGLGGVGQAVTGGAAAGVAAISGVAEEGAEAVTESANTLALGVNTTALGALSTAIGAGVTALSGLVTAIGTIFSGATTVITGAATLVEAGAIKVVAALIANTAALIESTAVETVSTIIPFAGGGSVRGPNVKADVVRARLTPGEFVLRQRAASYYGGTILHAMNQMLVPRDLLNRFRANVHIAAPVGMFHSGGTVQSGNETEPALVPAIVVADDGAMERLLAGGQNEFFRFLDDHGPRIAALLDQHRGQPR